MAHALGYDDDRSGDSYRYGTVRSVNADGSANVLLGTDGTLTRCTALYTPVVGDRAQVVVKSDGSCVAIGRVGGTVRDVDMVGLGDGAVLYKVENLVMMSIDAYKTSGKWALDSATELTVPVGFRPYATSYVQLVNLAYLSCRLKVNGDGSVVYQGNDDLAAGYELYGSGAWLTA